MARGPPPKKKKNPNTSNINTRACQVDVIIILPILHNYSPDLHSPKTPSINIRKEMNFIVVKCPQKKKKIGHFLNK